MRAPEAYHHTSQDFILLCLRPNSTHSGKPERPRRILDNAVGESVTHARRFRLKIVAHGHGALDRLARVP